MFIHSMLVSLASFWRPNTIQETWQGLQIGPVGPLGCCLLELWEPSRPFLATECPDAVPKVGGWIFSGSLRPRAPNTPILLSFNEPPLPRREEHIACSSPSPDYLFSEHLPAICEVPCPCSTACVTHPMFNCPLQSAVPLSGRKEKVTIPGRCTFQRQARST